MTAMLYPTKTAIIIRNDLLGWQKANVAAFLAGGLAGTFPEMVGEAYRDGDQRCYTPLIREPVFIYGADADELGRTYQRAVSRDLYFAIYTEPLFKTSNDLDNRAAVAASRSNGLELVGVGLHAERKVIDKVVHGLKFMS